MAAVVFILGAGCSKHAGAPLMNDFLDRAEALRRADDVDDAWEDFDLVFKGIKALQMVSAKAQIDQDNLEEVFAAFEMAELLGCLGDLSSEETEGLPSALKHVIRVTLEKSVMLEWSRSNTNEFSLYQLQPSETYKRFASTVKDLSEKLGENDVSIITFNYDLCLDYALYHSSINVDYCLNVPQKGMKLLKLHGSLSWKRDGGKEEVDPVPITSLIPDEELRYPRQAVEPQVPQFKGIAPLRDHGNREIIIVPPTWNKMQHHSSLKSVWASAASELKSAEYICVCGYSLPESDHFFRHLFALGTIGEARIKEFAIVNPDDSVKGRFEKLLGSRTLKRMKYYQLAFGSLDHVASVSKILATIGR